MKTTPSRRLLLSLAGAIALLAGAGALATLSTTPGQQSVAGNAVGARPMPVETGLLRRSQGFDQLHHYLGTVEATRRSGVGFELAGELASILVDEGDRVSRGQILAHLDTDRLQARRAELIAAVGVARAELDLARSTRTRVQDLERRGHESGQRLDEVREGFRAARAALALAEARVQALDTEIAKSALRAPFDARITLRHLDEGRVAAAGVPVLTLQEDAPARVRVGVPGHVADSLDASTAYTVRIDDRAHAARLRAVLPVKDDRTRTVDILFDLDVPAARLREGEIAELSMARHQPASGAWVPLEALSAGVRGTWVLYTLQPGPGTPFALTVVPATVELLAEGDSRAYVRGGFGDGDRYVTRGLNRIVPGQTVTAVPEDGEAR